MKADDGLEKELDPGDDAVVALTQTLMRRQQLLLDAIERVNEEFNNDLR